MSNTHDGVSCDNCMKSNFSGKRYKCLICYDFDLCGTCYDQSQALISITNTSSSSSSSSIQNETISSSKSNKKLKSYKLRVSEPAIQVVKPPTAVSTTSNNIKINQSSHLNTHAMQCILTRGDQELFYGSGGGRGITCDFTIAENSIIEQQSFTCPYCAKFGFSETSLCKHLTSHHSNMSIKNQTQLFSDKKEVVCPICAVIPSSNGGDPNHLTDNLLHHINMEHIINNTNNITSNKTNNIGSTTRSNKNSKKNLDDTLNDIGLSSLNGTSNLNSSSSANAVAAAAAALRFSRRLNYSQNSSRSSLTAQSGITIGNSNNRAGGNSINRYAFQFGQSSSATNSGPNALSSFMRNTSHPGSSIESLTSSISNQMDPIAELLSQLTGVRRLAGSTYSASNQLQQLQQQLNRERESLQQQSTSAGVIAAAGSGGQGASTRHHHMHHHLFNGGGSISKSQLLNSLSQSKSNNQNNLLISQNSSIQAVQTANNITNAFLNQVLELPSNYFFTQSLTPKDPRYLLSKYDFSTAENHTQNPNINQINQSIFINDILTLLLSKQLYVNESLVLCTNSVNQKIGSNANKQKNANKTSIYKQISQTSEDDLGDELLRTSSSMQAEICKNKANLGSSSEQPKLLEL